MDTKEFRERAEREYERWCSNCKENDEYYKELISLSTNDAERIDSFYKALSFGTSGIRGLMGPGTNRINGYVIRKATQGVANFLRKTVKSPAVVVAYDSRKGSEYYARETAAVLKGNGIDVCLFEEVAPVPLLSYAITKMECDMGIMITASHNPKKYNGYKVFNRHGYQITGDTPELILKEIDALDYFDEFPYDAEHIYYGGKQIGEAFVQDIRKRIWWTNPEIMNCLKTVYTPLNGTGGAYVSSVFDSVGYHNYKIVPSQEKPDENFPTCPQPNPEKILTYKEGFELLDRSGGDIIIATDPDADRIGVAFYHNGSKILLSGNQLGILILDYLCHMLPPRKGQIVAKSIATTPLALNLAHRFGMKVVNTLPGFKYIGEFITRLENAGMADQFYFGFEESNGYLYGPSLKEKDGISGALLAVVVASFHKCQGKDLLDRLYEIYDEYGYCVDKTRNYYFHGPKGAEKMAQIMSFFRTEINDTLGGKQIVRKIDYMQPSGLPPADVLQFDLDDGSMLLIRPSGTEPKMKIYSFESDDFKDVEEEIGKVIDYFRGLQS